MDNEGLPTNKDRAARAAKAIEQFTDGQPRDLLADLMHYCSQNGMDLEEELELARRAFLSEESEAAMPEDQLI